MKSSSRGNARPWKCAGRFAAVGVIGLVSTGCLSSTEPPTQVWGRISYHGEPVRGGVIVLSPNTGPGDSWGMGVIKENGEYTVVSARNDAPIAAGRYGVSFRRPARFISPRKRYAEEGATPKESAADGTKEDIPEKYMDTEHPIFSIDVGDRPIQVDITLRD